MMRRQSLLWACVGIASLLSCASLDSPHDVDGSNGMELTPEMASRFAGMALKGIQREYPNKLDHVMSDVNDLRSPAKLHPTFYGSFDWHSSVHGHWMLVRLLKRDGQLPEAGEIRRVLETHLSAENVAAELAYLQGPNRKSFERTYGWAWLLKLAEELYTWDDPDGRRWSQNLAPLAETFAERYLDFLPRQTYPIRRGVHPNTAFGIAFALDYARAMGHEELEALLLQRSRDYFLQDRDIPARWEPDGDDFFSRALMEADLMRRVLPAEDYSAWFHDFLPTLKEGEPRSLLQPAQVADRSDPKIVHLDGLNLSRAWCMKGIASSLPDGDPVKAVLLASAERHARATLPHITSGHYEGEHWLASFAVTLLTMECPAPSRP